MKKSSETRNQFPWGAMSAIGFTVFATVTSEFLPTGMLPSMAADLGVSTSQIGFLVSVWALTVVMTAIPMSIVTRRFARKSLLVTSVILFTISNVAASMTTSYEVMLVSRVVGALGNAMFWMIAGGYITTLLPAHLRSRGFLFVSGGANLAFVLGMPIGSAIAAISDWKSAFLIMTGLTIGSSVVLYFLLTPIANPHQDVPPESRSVRRDKTFPLVLLAVSGVFLVIGGGNIFYPYITPFLIEASNFSTLTVALPLAAYGIGGTIGIVIAERLGRNPRLLSRNIALAVLFMAVVLVLLNPVSQSQFITIVTVALFGLGFSIVEPLYGQYIMEVSSPRMRDFAGAMRTTAWNLGIGSGSFLGGVLLVPLGLIALPYLGSAILILASALALVSRRFESRAT